MIFYLGRGDFIIFLAIDQPNDLLQKKSKSKHALTTNLYAMQKGMIIKGI